MYNLKIINSTTRPGRKGIIISSWIANAAKEHPEFNVELVDLGEVNLPMMDEPFHPAMQKYQNQHTKDWSAKIDAADAFIFVTAEYNGSYPAPLKNALDYLVKEWGHKAAGIVSYGGVSGGTRAAQMLKLSLSSLRITPLVESVSIPFFDQFINDEDVFVGNDITEQAAKAMLDELARQTAVLKTLRSK